MTNRNALDDDHIGRLLIKLALAAFLGMVVMTLYTIVDSIFFFPSAMIVPHFFQLGGSWLVFPVMYIYIFVLVMAFFPPRMEKYSIARCLMKTEPLPDTA